MSEENLTIEEVIPEETVELLTNTELVKCAKASIKARGMGKIFGFMFVIFLCLILSSAASVFLGQGINIILQWIASLIGVSYFLGLVYRKEFDMGFIKTSFVRVGTIVGATLLISLIVVLPIIIACVIAGVVALPIAFGASDDAKIATTIITLVVAISIGSIFTIILGYRYRLVYFIMAEDKLLPVKEILKRSRLLMNGHKKQGFSLELKYMLMIVLLYLIPIALWALTSAKIIPALVGGILGVLAFIYAIIFVIRFYIVLITAWAEFYKNLKSINIYAFEKDEELYPNYKMAPIRTVALVAIVILYGLTMLGIEHSEWGKQYIKKGPVGIIHTSTNHGADNCHAE